MGLRIVWHSNSRQTPTGYGNQTNLFVPYLHKSGHHVDISAFYPQQSVVLMDEDGIRTFPPLADAFGNDILESHFAFCDADVLVTLCDPFCLRSELVGRMPWAAWAPIDGEPVRPQNKQVLEQARWIWAMSRWGERQLREAGFARVTYVPHGVDMGTFRPIDRAMARREAEKLLKVELGDRFMVFMNSANKGTPSRKGFGYAFEAFKRFCDEWPAATLVVHSDVTGVWHGEDLERMARQVGLNESQIVFTPQYLYSVGLISSKHLNILYNAADVFLHTSLGEGFGIPLVEAQAAGCPVIAQDYSSMAELVGSGWRLRDGKPVWVVDGFKMRAPDVGEVASVLDSALSEMDLLGRRVRAREWAMTYDYRQVAETHMLPALAQIEAEIRAERTLKAEA